MSRVEEPMDILEQEEYDEMSHSALSEKLGPVVWIQRMDKADYTHEEYKEVYIKLRQIFDPQYTSWDICKKH